MLKHLLLLGTTLCFSCQVYAGGDAKNMTDHELRVKASWNCESAKGWCAEDQSVTYNKCKCAKRMCDAAQRAGEAAERGYDNGVECKDGGSYCGTAKSDECKQVLESGESGGSSGGGAAGIEGCTPCSKIEGKEMCVLKPGCECDCSQVNGGGGEGEGSSTGNAKGLTCDEVKRTAAIHKSRCEKGNKQACKDYEDRKKEAERCDKEKEKSSGTGKAKGDDCSTVIKKVAIHKSRCDKGNKQACKDYEDRKKEAERCEKNGAGGSSSKSSSSSSSNSSSASRWVQTRDGAVAGGIVGGPIGVTVGAIAGMTKDKNMNRISNELKRETNDVLKPLKDAWDHVF